MALVTDLYRYPVKGLSAEPQGRVTLAVGEGVPLDRAFAIAHGTTRFDPDAPQPLPKTHFLMLAVNERMAALKSAYDDTTGVLTINRDGRAVVRAKPDQPGGRQVIEQFFAAYMKDECRGAPRLVHAPGHTFADCKAKRLSLIGLPSICDLERVVRQPVDPVRFRANVYFDGTEPWAEFGWIGREIIMGTARLRVVARIDRCPATDVNPGSARRDMNIPRALQAGFGHIDMGVYAEVVQSGDVAVGDRLDAG
ncbi:MAG TPA: MOSC domain-containing protein [Candidatus Cybelea sp.]|nr:MOSC domain-containing protein [Candidatus Cybelea sp.]